MTPATLNVPASDSTVTVHAINTTTNMVTPLELLLEPAIAGFENLNLPTFAFLIENKSNGRTILFDNGSRKDWWNLAPHVADSIEKGIPGLDIQKNVNEILED